MTPACRTARTLRGAALLAVMVGVAAACDIVAPPSGAPTATAEEFVPPQAPERAQVVACVSIQPYTKSSASRVIVET